MARKKQKKITAVTLAILSGLNGCGSIDVSKDYEDYTITKEQYVSEYTEQFDYLEVVTVEYPILSGLGREPEENINKILYDMAMEKVDYWHLTPNEEVKALQKEYSIYSSDVHCDINFHSQYLLSVHFRETYAPFEPVSYVQTTQRCANINIITGEQYLLTDIFQIDDDFMALWCKQVETEGNYGDLIINDADTRETLGAWFLGEDKETEEYYTFTPFFSMDKNKDFVIGLSYDPKPNQIQGGPPHDNSFYAHFQSSDLDTYRTDSEFWTLYDKSENTGKVIENGTPINNLWLGENASVWEYWKERQ